MFSMYNVVGYDGHDAYVFKFILNDKTYRDDWTAAGQNGLIDNDIRYLYFDKLYTVNFSDIIDLFRNIEQDEITRLIIERFTKMYFEN